MKRDCAHHRLIAAILVLCVLGLLFVNALSTSHSQLEHRHTDGRAHVAETHVDHDHDAAPEQASDEQDGEHSHQHDPGDHTHDFPLRRVLAVGRFAFTPLWQPALAIPFRSVVVHPLERPPRLPPAASLT